MNYAAQTEHTLYAVTTTVGGSRSAFSVPLRRSGTAPAFDNAGLTHQPCSTRRTVKYPLEKREVSSHYFTGVDIPLLSWQELTNRLGPDYSDPITGSTGINDDGTPGGTDVDPGGVICTLDQPCLNEYGQPRVEWRLRREDSAAQKCAGPASVWPEPMLR